MPTGSGGGGGVSASAIRMGRAFVELGTDDSKLIKGLESAKRKFQTAAAAMNRIGRVFFTAGLALATPLALATKTFVGFDDAVKALGANSTGTAEELTTLVEHAKALSVAMGTSATEIVKLQTELGRSGFSRVEIDAMTASILNLARATGTEAPVSATILSETLRDFKMQAGDAALAADLLAKAANISASDLTGLGESLGEVGATAKGAGVSLRDTLTLFAGLSNYGIKGTSAGTAVRGIIASLASEGDKLFATFGVRNKDAQGNLRPILDIMAEIGEATKNLGSADKSAKFNEFFGLLRFTAATVISDNIDAFRDLRGELDDVTGAAAKAAKEMDSGIGGAFRRLKAGAEVVAIAVGDALAGSLSDLAGRLGTFAADLTNFIAKNKEFVLVVAQGVAGLIAGGVAFIAFGAVLNGLATTLGAVLVPLKLIGATLAFILTPFGLLTAAVGGATAAWLAFSEKGQAAAGAIKEGLGNIGETLGITAGGIADALKLGDLEAAGRVAFLGLQAAWADAVAAMKKVWINFQQSAVGETLMAFVRGIKVLGGGAAFGAKWLADEAGRGVKIGGGGATSNTITGPLDFVDKSVAGWMTAWKFVTEGKEAAKQFRRTFDEDLQAGAAKEQRDRAAALAEADLEAWLPKFNLAMEAAFLQMARARKEDADAAAKAEKANYAMDAAMKKIDFENSLRQLERGRDMAANIAGQLRGETKGAFGGPLAMQLAAGDTAAKKQLDALENIDGKLGKLPKQIGAAVADQLKTR